MTATDNLETRCRRLVQRKTDDSDPAGHVAQEIALTLTQIDEVREHRRELADRLSKQELGLKTRIANLTTPPFEYDFDKWARRAQMQHQLEASLVKLEQQSQRLAMDRERRLHALEDRLFELWSRQSVV